MKNKKTLYKLILKEFKKDEDKFICSVIDSLKSNKQITSDEHEMIFEDFKKNHPTDILHSEFKNDSWIDSYAWWHEDKEIRVNFLTKLIEINS